MWREMPALGPHWLETIECGAEAGPGVEEFRPDNGDEFEMMDYASNKTNQSLHLQHQAANDKKSRLGRRCD